jgi:hypothetical protein
LPYGFGPLFLRHAPDWHRHSLFVLAAFGGEWLFADEQEHCGVEQRQYGVKLARAVGS